MRVLFLGTGTSHGVPAIGCECAVCSSADPRDRRLRPSIYLECDDDTRVLVDTSPDLRTQALTHSLRRVDAICLTHAHADHIMGLDDVRRFNAMSGKTMPIYGRADTLDDIRRIFHYAFEVGKPAAGGVPDLQLVPVDGPFAIGRQTVVPVPISHGRATILGFRVGRFAYLTDCSAVPESSFALLEGLDTLVIDALRHEPHPTHFTVREAIETARRIGPAQTYLTHIAHDLGHAATSAALPPGVALAYDGLCLDVPPRQ